MHSRPLICRSRLCVYASMLFTMDFVSSPCLHNLKYLLGRSHERCPSCPSNGCQKEIVVHRIEGHIHVLAVRGNARLMALEARDQGTSHPENGIRVEVLVS